MNLRKPQLPKNKQPILGTTKKGYPIFGYNDRGVPICNSSLGTKAGRCQVTALYPNGRCRVHGGPLTSQNPFLDHSMRQQLYRSTLPADMGLIFSSVLADPEVTSLKAEISLNSVQIAKLLEAIAKHEDLDNSSWQELLAIANRVEELLFDPAISSAFELTKSKKPAQFQDEVEKMLLRLKRGADKHKLFVEINQAVEYRRKLVETELKREEKQRTTIAVSDVLLIFRNFVSVVVKIWQDDAEGMQRFMGEIDKSALNVAMAQQANVLGLAERPSAMINPTCVLTEEMQEQLADIRFHEKQEEEAENERKEMSKHGGYVHFGYTDQAVAEIMNELEAGDSDGEDVLLEPDYEDDYVIDPNRDRSTRSEGLPDSVFLDCLKNRKVKRKLKVDFE